MTRDELLRALDELIIPHGKLAEYWTIYEFIIDSTKEEDKMPALLKPVKVGGGCLRMLEQDVQPAGEYPPLPRVFQGDAPSGNVRAESDYYNADQMRAYVDTDRAMRAKAASTTDSYVQPVPDKCDRIVWRGNYYHLPLTPPTQAADSELEDAERLKEAAGLLEELAEHGSYSIEYDGRMIPICPECGEQEGDHRPDCAFARAKAFLAARKR